eukprot:7379810-Prymnesium_polylepis.1
MDRRSRTSLLALAVLTAARPLRSFLAREHGPAGNVTQVCTAVQRNYSAEGISHHVVLDRRHRYGARLRQRPKQTKRGCWSNPKP